MTILRNTKNNINIMCAYIHRSEHLHNNIMFHHVVRLRNDVLTMN
jgi:hypothetical protein